MDTTETGNSSPDEKRTSDDTATEVTQENKEVRSGSILQLVAMDDERDERDAKAEENRDSEKAEVRMQTEEPVSLPRGDSFDPYKSFAVLVVIDVARAVRKIRKLPSFHHIVQAVTVIGNGKRADIKVDDFETVRGHHGAIVFRGGQFYVFPLQGVVVADGKGVSEEGARLKHGSTIEMGSASFLFMMI